MKPGRRFTEVESCSIVSLRCRGTWRGDVICNITARSSLSPRLMANGLRDASRASRSHRDKLGGARKSPHPFRKIQPSNGRPPGCRPKTRRLAAARVGRRRATNVAGTNDTSLQPPTCVDAGGHPDRERGLPRSLHAESNPSRFAFLPRGRPRYGRWRVVAWPHLSARRGRRRGSS